MPFMISIYLLPDFITQQSNFGLPKELSIRLAHPHGSQKQAKRRRIAHSAVRDDEPP